MSFLGNLVNAAQQRIGQAYNGAVHDYQQVYNNVTAQQHPVQTMDPQAQQAIQTAKYGVLANNQPAQQQFIQQQAAPPPRLTLPSSAMYAGTHNGVTDFAGGLVKPLVRSSMALNQGIGNAEVGLAHTVGLAPNVNTQNAQQYSKQFGNNFSKAIDYTGTKRQIIGDAVSNIANVGMPGTSKLASGVVSKVVPKILPEAIKTLAPKVVGGAVAGAGAGAVGNLGGYVASGQPMTLKGAADTAKTGAAYGAAFGAAMPLAPIAAKGAVKGAQTFDKTLKTAQSKAATNSAIDAGINDITKQQKTIQQRINNAPLNATRGTESLQQHINILEGQKAQLHANRPQMNPLEKVLSIQPGLSMKDISGSAAKPGEELSGQVAASQATPLKHFTTPDVAAKLQAGQSFDYSQAPIHGTGSIQGGYGDRLVNDGKPALYLSKDDKTWGTASIPSKTSEKVNIDNITPQQMQDGYFQKNGITPQFDYATQKYVGYKNAFTTQKLQGVDYHIAPDARHLTIDSPAKLQEVSKQVGTSADDPKFWSALRKNYDVVNVTNVAKNRTVEGVGRKFFNAAKADQSIVLNPDKVSTKQPTQPTLSTNKEQGSLIPRINKNDKPDYNKLAQQLVDKHNGSITSAGAELGIPSSHLEHMAPLDDIAHALKMRDATAAPSTKQLPAQPSEAVPALQPKAIGTSAVSSANGTPKAPKERGFTASVKNSDNYSPQLKQAVEQTSKIDNSVSDKAAMNAASDRANTIGINKMHTQALNSLNSGRVLSKQEIVNAGTVLNHLDAAGRHDEAQTLHNLLSEKGTAGGQQSQAFAAILKRNPNGVLYDSLSKLQHNGIKVTPQIQGEMQGLRDALAKTQPNTIERARAEGQMDKYVASKLPSGTGEKLFALWRSGLLTGARTLGKIGTSHTAHSVAEGLTNVVAAPIDRAVSLVSGKRSGALTADSLGKGFKQGASNAKYYLKTGIETNPHDNTAEFRPGANFGVNKKGERTLLDKATGGASSKILNTYTNVGRLHGAMYQPFNESFRQNEIASLARAYAANKGLKGADAKAFVENFKANPESQAGAYAKTRADTATFQQETALGKVASALQQKGGIMGKVIAPFTRIPSAIATDVFNYSPAGAVKTIIDGIKAAKSDTGWTVESQRAFTQGLGRSIVGTAAIAPGIYLYDKGLLNLGYPTDQKEQKLWAQEGRTPNSVKVGGKWRSLGSIGPTGAALEIGGAIAANMKKGDDAMTATYKGMLNAAQAISEQSYLAGTNAAVNAVKDPGRYGGKLANQYASSVIPTLVNNTAQATDKFMRRVDNPLQAIQNALPGAREKLPTKTDSFGNPQPTPQGGNPLAAVDPFYSYNVRNQNNSQITELRRLQDNGQGAMPATIKKVESIGSANVKLTPDQVSTLQKLYGQKVQSAWNTQMQTPAYQSANDVGKQKQLQNVASNAEQQAKAEFAKQNLSVLNSQVQKPGTSINPSKLTSKPYAPTVPKAPSTSGTPKIPGATHTTYDSATNTWTQKNVNTGKTVKIDASGNRTIVNPGTSKTSTAQTTTYNPTNQTWTQVSPKTGRTTVIAADGTRTVTNAGTRAPRTSTGRRSSTLTGTYRQPSVRSMAKSYGTQMSNSIKMTKNISAKVANIGKVQKSSLTGTMNSISMKQPKLQSYAKPSAPAQMPRQPRAMAPSQSLPQYNKKRGY